MRKLWLSIIVIAVFGLFGAPGCSDPETGSNQGANTNQGSPDTDATGDVDDDDLDTGTEDTGTTDDAGDNGSSQDAGDAGTTDDAGDNGSTQDAGDNGSTQDAGDDSDAGDDPGDPDCDSDELYCDGECRSCPESGVAEAECDGDQCVAATCDDDYVTCTLGCCSVDPTLVDDAGDGGSNLEITIDDQGYPHVVYDRISQMPRHVQYAWFDGDQWHNETVEGGNPEDGNKGNNLSMDLDSQQRVHIGYRRHVSGVSGGRYAVQDGDGWEIESIPSSAGGDNIVLAVDDDDNPWAIHTPGVGSEIYMTHLEDGEWTDAPVETSFHIEGFPRDLIIDSEKRPHFVGEPLGTGNAFYLSKQEPDSSSWYATVLVDSIGSAEIRLDAEEDPVIGFLDESSTFRPKLAWWDDIEWDIDTVQECTDGCGRHTSMVLDSQERPHFAYRSRDNGEEVIYAHNDGSGWTHTVVAELNSYPESIALDVDADDRAHIVYRDDDPSHIRYVVVEP